MHTVCIIVFSKVYLFDKYLLWHYERVCRKSKAEERNLVDILRFIIILLHTQVIIYSESFILFSAIMFKKSRHIKETSYDQFDLSHI